MVRAKNNHRLHRPGKSVSEDAKPETKKAPQRPRFPDVVGSQCGTTDVVGSQHTIPDVIGSQRTTDVVGSQRRSSDVVGSQHGTAILETVINEGRHVSMLVTEVRLSEVLSSLN